VKNTCGVADRRRNSVNNLDFPTCRRPRTMIIRPAPLVATSASATSSCAKSARLPTNRMHVTYINVCYANFSEATSMTANALPLLVARRGRHRSIITLRILTGASPAFAASQRGNR
jgi:hypothetical protein